MRPPWLDQRRGAVEHRVLVLDALLERAGPHPPLGVRIAPPGPDAGAGRVDQHEVDAAARDRPAEVARRRCGVRTWTLRAPARASRAWIGASRRLSVSVAIELAAIFHHAPRARASCRRRRRRDRSRARRGRAPASSAASWEPSSCTSTSPLMKAGSAWIGRALGFGARARCAARRRPRASARRRDGRAPRRLVADRP